MIYVHPAAEPFFIRGETDSALLLLHGFTASPTEVYPVADLVHAANFSTVSGILLPGHGSDPRFLNRCTWEDWYRAVEIELDYFLASYEHVYVGGLSLGALLAMYAGLKLKGIKGVIAINAPIYNRKPLLTRCAPLLKYIKPYFPKQVDEEMRELEKAGRFAYRVMPVKAYQSLMELRKIIMQEISGLKIPLLVVQSRLDESVDIRSGRYLHKKTQAAGSSLLELGMSAHIASMGPEKERIAQEIVTFMAADPKGNL
ncbi:Esterase/lipase [Syntrophomonas zehnderi OL-4]|uniref:Esterase/lipase n=2 Tax=Syntrophomonas TaxID=862 RepID=A0A0E4C8W1_9FIRM|nr:Esterase/lipase [Syntrophomonas zehnderi OL-4]